GRTAANYAARLQIWVKAAELRYSRYVWEFRTCRARTPGLLLGCSRWPWREWTALRLQSAWRKPALAGTRHAARTHGRPRPPPKRSPHYPHDRKPNSVPFTGLVAAVRTGP